MKTLKLFVTFIFLLSFTISELKAQPVPIDVMFGNKYGSTSLIYSKKFGENSRFGFFHLNTLEFNYSDANKNSIILQDVLFMETIKNVRVTAGAAYSKVGFSPTAGMQYLYGSRKVFFLFAPRVNIEQDPSYSVMTILQYKPKINDKLNLFARIKLLNIFDNGGNIKSYQWMRLGLDKKGIQFGLALNLDEYGPNPSISTNYGLFVRKEIF